MPRPKHKAPPKDPHAAVKSIVDAVIAAGEAKPDKNPAAVALGRLGGLKGGIARKKALTPEQRRKIAQKAAESRWKKGNGEKR